MPQEAKDLNKEQDIYTYTGIDGKVFHIEPVGLERIEVLALWFKRLDEYMAEIDKKFTVRELYLSDWIFRSIADKLLLFAEIDRRNITLDQLADLILPGTDEEGNAVPAILKRVNNLP